MLPWAARAGREQDRHGGHAEAEQENQGEGDAHGAARAAVHPAVVLAEALSA